MAEAAPGESCGDGTTRHASRVPRSSEPGSGAAPLAVVGERVPGIELAGSAPEDVPEAAEGAPARDGDRKALGEVVVVERVDEVLHVLIRVP